MLGSQFATVLQVYFFPSGGWAEGDPSSSITGFRTICKCVCDGGEGAGEC